MPVRIYEIAKKVGVESKQVLAKAKELGIPGAKVPSSSLDKITAEYLEEQLGGVAVAKPEPAPAPPEPVIIVSAPPEEEEVKEEAPPQTEPQPPAEAPAIPPQLEAAPEETPPTQAPPQPEVAQAPPQPAAEVTPEPAAPEAAPAETAEAPPQPAEVSPEAAPAEPAEAAQPAETEPATEAPEQPKQPPEAPAGPKLGEKVGFIQLPPKPRPPEKGAAAKQPAARTGRDRAPAERDDRRRDARPDARGGTRPRLAPPIPKGREAARPAAAAEAKFVPPTSGEVIVVKPPIIVRDLAQRLNKKPFQLIADLMQLNVFANVNQAIEEPVAQKLCAKYGFRFELEKRERGAGVTHQPVKKIELEPDDDPKDLKPRPPVVTIMGHVDHGKTTLLDVIRKSDVVKGEAGGITQHIGAYTITIPHPERPDDLEHITFLDTPGHAAFSAMRARGANVTDIVILVVAANDGVMPQTMEAIDHAMAANVPIIVAVNKCDHPSANPMKARQQLQEKGLVPEEWGGNTIFSDVSALTGENVNKLLELVLLQAEIMELRANPNRRAKGNVVESGLERSGPTATVLVRKGTLRVGDAVICGPFWGKVRALINEEGGRIKEAGPSTAVKVLGLNGVPEAGLEFSVLENEKIARDLATQQAEENRGADMERRPKVTLENLFDTLASEASKLLRIVVKADTQGSAEAIVDALNKIESDKVQLDVLHSGVGTITESDVMLASASKAIVLGFHTRLDNAVSEVAKREGVQIKLYSIIYELIDEVKEAMAGLLDPVNRELVVGAGEVRKVFELSKGGTVAGCAVTNGRIVKGKIRVYRKKNLLFDGSVQSLRRFQDEVNEVRLGMECGIRLDGFDKFEEGDTLESYTVEQVAQKL